MGGTTKEALEKGKEANYLGYFIIICNSQSTTIKQEGGVDSVKEWKEQERVRMNELMIFMGHHGGIGKG